MLNSNDLHEPPKTTVIEAKKLLGRKYSYLTDHQVQELVNVLTLIARKSLKL